MFAPQNFSIDKHAEQALYFRVFQASEGRSEAGVERETRATSGALRSPKQRQKITPITQATHKLKTFLSVSFSKITED